MTHINRIFRMTATAFTVALIVLSCKSKLKAAEDLDMSKSPLQEVDSMYLIQSKNGAVTLRVFANVMERFDNDSVTYETFPMGLNVYSYGDDGVLESTIRSDNAMHKKNKRSGVEMWQAFGNVVVRNLVNHQTMQSDTIYWDRTRHEIYTDCYIRMYSPDGFIQGYGMRSDEKARNAMITRPFNNYAVVVKDTNEVIIDTANFIGPLLKSNHSQK